MPARRAIDKRRTFVWPGSFENWSRSWVHKNHWRVRHHIGSEDDCLAACAELFCIVVNKYAATVDNPAWMMSLFKTTVRNEWITWAQKDQRKRTTLESAQLDAYQELAYQTDYNYGPLLAQLAGASDELQLVLRTIAKAPAEFLDLMLSADTPELTNRRMRRLCKIKADVDLVGELRALLA